MSTFTGDVADLSEAISYERDALEFIRATLFDQIETNSQALTIDLSKGKNDSGFYPVTAHLTAHISISAGAVRSALAKLRPLAFSSAFKMHDLVVEWILRANGSSTWRFKEKVADYERMFRDGSLSEPPALAGWPMGSRAFWSLYKILTPFRNKIVHAGSFSVAGDTLNITAERGTLSLSHKDQGAYIRAVCLIADYMLSNSQIDPRRAVIVENDLYTLTRVHNVAGLLLRSMRFASVEAVAAIADGVDGRPGVTINFDDIRQAAERSFPTDGILAFELTIRAERGGRKLRWVFPPLMVLAGEKRLTEGDSEFAPYFVGE